MANGYPTVFPAGFNGGYQDFLKAKIDRSGALREYKGTVSVPAATAIGTKIGIIPVRKGAYVQVNGSSIWFDSLDSTNTATASIGITYQPGSASTEAPAQYVAAGNTSIRAGGNVVLNGVKGGLIYQVLDDGWLSVTTAAAATDTLGNITFNVGISYDAGALS